MLIPEFERQSGVLVSWPHPATDWADRLDEVEKVYLAIVRAVARHQAILVICHDTETLDRVRRLLEPASASADRILLQVAPCNDTWTRDYGPLGTEDAGAVLLHDFTFDGWGGKHPAALDNRVTGALMDAGVFSGTPCAHHSLVLEGGSIETDGRGTLMTTTRCLLTASRNPGLDRVQLEEMLSQLLGISRVLWLEHGVISGDDTDGHIDMLARFCAPGHILYTGPSAETDSDHDELAKMQAQLATFTDIDDQPYRLTALPCPSPVLDADGRRLPASYANFLVINEAVLLPVYGVPEDAHAIRTVAGCFPGREVYPIDCLPLIRQNGSLHCATMQVPAGVTLSGVSLNG